MGGTVHERRPTPILRSAWRPTPIWRWQRWVGFHMRRLVWDNFVAGRQHAHYEYATHGQVARMTLEEVYG